MTKHLQWVAGKKLPTAGTPVRHQWITTKYANKKAHLFRHD
jgi:hypothetical protein